MPEYSYMYFWDYKNCPYWDKSDFKIRELTILWIKKLINSWCNIIIIACNTAAAHSLRYIQTSNIFPWIKILWVTIPWVEKILDNNYKQVWVIATSATVRAKSYKKRAHITNKNIKFIEIAVPWLVEAIELEDKKLITKILKEIKTKFLKNNIKELDTFSSKGLIIDSLVLWCTHYAIIEEEIKNIFKDIDIINPSYESAIKLKIYLNKHKSIKNKIKTWWNIIFLL